MALVSLASNWHVTIRDGVQKLLFRWVTAEESTIKSWRMEVRDKFLMSFRQLLFPVTFVTVVIQIQLTLLKL